MQEQFFYTLFILLIVLPAFVIVAAISINVYEILDALGKRLRQRLLKKFDERNKE